MSQQRQANSWRQDSAVFTHLQHKKNSINDQEVHILDREGRWVERGVKEAIYIKVEQPSLNRGGV